MIDVAALMPALIAGAAVVAAAVVGGAGVLVGHWVAARRNAAELAIRAEEVRVREIEVRKSAESRMIDQFQEELAPVRAQQEARMTAQDERMTQLEARNGILVDRTDRYRDLLHKHRSHIWDGKPPPPPEWPEDLPR